MDYCFLFTWDRSPISLSTPILPSVRLKNSASRVRRLRKANRKILIFFLLFQIFKMFVFNIFWIFRRWQVYYFHLGFFLLTLCYSLAYCQWSPSHLSSTISSQHHHCVPYLNLLMLGRTSRSRPNRTLLAGGGLARQYSWGQDTLRNPLLEVYWTLEAQRMVWW